MRRIGVIGFLLLVASLLGAAEVMPPPPARYFNDYARVVSAQTAERLNRQLEDFEKATSSQVVVAVFPKMESPSSLEDYVHRMFQAWKIGQQQRNNGVLLAVFTQDRKLRIETGYGLEGPLPDALSRRIIADEITPRFKQGDYDAGITAGVNAILAATRGEYKGTGGTARVAGPQGLISRIIFNRFFPWHLFLGFLLLRFLLGRIFGRRGTVYDSGGRRSYGGWISGGGGSWGGGGGSSGGFSGGGGSSGGGGASGSW